MLVIFGAPPKRTFKAFVGGRSVTVFECAKRYFLDAD